MKGFEDVTLSWNGQEYIVPAGDQLRLIAVIEDALIDGQGNPAVVVLTRRSAPSYARLSAAYGAALRHAGADVTDDEVYLTLQEDMADGKAEVSAKIQTAIYGLLAIVSPPVMSRIAKAASDKPVGKSIAPATD